MGPADRSKLEILAKRLAPDNIAQRPVTVCERDDAFLALFNASPTVRREQTSVCMGPIFDHGAPWWRVGSGSPDGSFALVRSDADATELVSDAVGTRTLWYAHTDEHFVASTSQRAIVMWLQSYACNVAAFAWQVSSGTLGPGLSWDRRIRALSPASRLLFDARAWSTTLTTTPVEYRASAASPERHRRALHAAIDETFRALDLDTEQGALALSGGYDSRMILLMLKGSPRLRTVTWGRRSALADRHTDASVAQLLAAKLRTDHAYFELELPTDGVEIVLDRFVRLSEGRTDHIGGYTDGFSVWKSLSEQGVSAVFRGDEAFGCRAAPTTRDVYRNMKCTVLGDYQAETLGSLAELLPAQQRPSHLERRPSESLATWRDRLSVEFELPYAIAPLNDLKFGYVDIVHPLVSRRIIDQVRRLPDELRTDKRAFKSVVEATPLDVPFAKRGAVMSPDAVVAQPAVLDALRQLLREQSEGSDTAAALARHALERLPLAGVPTRRASIWMHRVLARTRPRRYVPLPRLDPLRVALRIYIIGKMQALLEDDARALR